MRSALLCVIPLLLAGCASLEVPRLSLPAAWRGAATTEAAAPNTAWWQALQNPELEMLISTTLVKNPEARQAQSRIAEAQGLKLQTTSALWPRADAFAGAREEADDGRGGRFTGGIEAAWELDVFGFNRAQNRSARASVRAAAAANDAVRISLVAAVARTYAETWARRVAVAAAQVQTHAATEAADVVAARHRAGLIGPIEYARSEERRANFSAQQATTQQDLAEVEQALAVLSGLTLKDVQALKKPQSEAQLPVLVQPISLTLVLATPLEVIENRPDVRVARAELEARIAETAAARALRWPNITLGGVLGLGGWSETPRSVAAGVAFPLLNFGAVRGAVRAADARGQVALAAYEGAVHAALVEIETRLAQWVDAETRLKRQHEAAQAALRAENAMVARTAAGLESAAALPEAKIATQSAFALFAQAQAAYVQAYANLFTAVAGASAVPAR